VPRVVVLVEGESDALVVRPLAVRRGLVVDVVAMGGITNVRRHVEELAGTATLLGLVDAAERRYLENLDPPLAGVFVCERDLEEELVRALGPTAVVEVLEQAGVIGSFRTFQGQPEWRGRDLTAQVRRFAGAGSGRKALLAAAMAERLGDDEVPAPLVALLDAADAVTRRDPPDRLSR
jgi:hypothetical protein